MISLFIHLIIWLIVLGLLVWLALYVIDTVVPEPIHKVARMVVIVLAVIIIILLLLQVVGGAGDLSLPKIGG